MKKVVAIFVTVVLTLTLIPIKTVFAVFENAKTDEMLNFIYENRVFKGIASSSNYEGFDLEWEYSSDILYDILVGVSGINLYASYEYDSNMNRIVKYVNNEITRYKYVDNKLMTEENTNYMVEFLYDEQKVLVGFVYNGITYDYVYDNSMITGIKQGGKNIVEYEYVDCGKIDVYDVSGGNRIKNENESFVGNVNKMRYNAKYYDEETGWCYVGRFYDFEDDRYIDGMNEIEIEPYIEEYGYTADILYHINTFMTAREGIEERETITTNNKTRASYEITLDEKTKTIARTIYGESHTDYRDIKGVARVIEERVRQTKEGISDYGGSTAYEVVTCDGQFLAYMNRNLPVANPDRSTYWDMNLDDGSPAVTLIIGCAICLNAGNPLIYSPELLDYSGQTFFTSLNSIKVGIDEERKKIVYVNGCWHLYTYTGNVITGDKKIKNLVTVFGKITSQSQLDGYANADGSKQIYNLFYSYK